MAKLLNYPGVGRNKLFEILRDRKILQEKDNTPYQKDMDNKWFRVIEQKYSVDGEVRISFKTLVLQKGIIKIREILEEMNR